MRGRGSGGRGGSGRRDDRRRAIGRRTGTGDEPEANSQAEPAGDARKKSFHGLLWLLLLLGEPGKLWADSGLLRIDSAEPPGISASSTASPSAGARARTCPPGPRIVELPQKR